MRYLKNVTTLRYDPGRCIGCGMCVEVCPHAVFELNGKKAVLRDADACMECGACKKNCPAAAIDVRPGVGCAHAIVVSRLRGVKAEQACCGPVDSADSATGKTACCG